MEDLVSYLTSEITLSSLFEHSAQIVILVGIFFFISFGLYILRQWVFAKNMFGIAERWRKKHDYS